MSDPTPIIPGQQSLTEPIKPGELEDDAAPKRGRGRPKGSTKANGAKSKSQPKKDAPPKSAPTATPKAVLREGIEQFYGVVGVTLQMVPSLKEAGDAAFNNKETIAQAWMEAADQNPAIRRFWEGLLRTSATGALVMAHLPIILAAVGPRMSIGSMFGNGGKEKAGPSRAPSGNRNSAAPPPPPPPPPPASGPVGVRVPPQNPGDLPPNPAFGDPPPEILNDVA